MISSSVTIQIKAIEQYFPVVLFIMLYKVVVTFEFMNETIQMKATGQYFPVVLFSMLYKVVLTFESVGEILNFRISPTDSKVRTTLYSILNSTTGKYCPVAFI